MNDSDFMTFARSWLQAPKNIGAAVPSGRSLAKLMASQVDPAEDGIVVELGAGTGAITRALLAQGISPDRLLVVEHDPKLAALVTRKMPQLNVICADARTLRQSLATNASNTTIAAIISSLPLLSMPRHLRWRIAVECQRTLGEHGKLIQFTYGPFSPLPDRLLHFLGWRAKRVGMVWDNFPPATVWHYEHENKITHVQECVAMGFDDPRLENLVD